MLTVALGDARRPDRRFVGTADNHTFAQKTLSICYALRAAVPVAEELNGINNQ